MLRFLEVRSQTGATAPLERLRSWLSALRIPEPDTTNVGIYGPYHHFPFIGNVADTFHATLDELRTDARNKGLPMMTVTKGGEVEVNDQFVGNFECDAEELNRILKESNGGFLPWGGDALARIIASERDLRLYIQMVSLNMEQLGPPEGYPIHCIIPSINVLNVIRKGKLARAIVRALQIEHIEERSFSCTTTLVFELPEESSSAVPPQPVSKVRTFTESEYGYKSESGYSPKKQLVRESSEFTDNLATVEDAFMRTTDDEWLSDLLEWASGETEPNALDKDANSI